MGFVFQHYALFRHMTVRENVAFGLAVRKAPKRERGRGSTSCSTSWGSPVLRTGTPSSSRAASDSGWPWPGPWPPPEGAAPRRAVRRPRRSRPPGAPGLARRAAPGARRDEPARHPRPGGGARARRRGRGHAPGPVEQVGSPEEIYNRPATPFVAGFVGSANILRGTVYEGHVHFGRSAVAGAYHLEDGEEAEAFVRPHDVELRRVPADSSFPVAVERRTNLGWMSKLHPAAGGRSELIAELPNEEIAGDRAGRQRPRDPAQREGLLDQRQERAERGGAGRGMTRSRDRFDHIESDGSVGPGAGASGSACPRRPITRSGRRPSWPPRAATDHAC